MTLFQNKYRVESTRLPYWDYSSDGWYFVTICTKNREEHFGKIQNYFMGLSNIGCTAAKFWNEIPNHFPFTRLDEWVVMPNHVHGIIVIDKNHPVEARHGAPLRWNKNEFGPLKKHSLQSIINHFKGAVKCWCNKNDYQ
ncbi:transposase, partial [Patescibacteria group bacterium]|nr:transposase [Patescibacteria group bacterium]